MIQVLRIVVAAAMGMFLFMCSGCAPTSELEALSAELEPLRACMPDGEARSITIADAMAYHHAHEDHPDDAAATKPNESAEEEGLCVGVATGYQAIRFAVSELFAGETPNASDLELSVAGQMPGVWDVFEMYLDRQLERPTPKSGKGKLSLRNFTFEATRVSSGKSVSFRLRESLIPERFFELKARGLSCDHPEVADVKDEAAHRILHTAPEDCFHQLK